MSSILRFIEVFGPLFGVVIGSFLTLFIQYVMLKLEEKKEIKAYPSVVVYDKLKAFSEAVIPILINLRDYIYEKKFLIDLLEEAPDMQEFNEEKQEVLKKINTIHEKINVSLNDFMDIINKYEPLAKLFKRFCMHTIYCIR